MISPLRATGVIASGTAMYLVVGVVVGKALAILVGPEGVGIWGLMQSLVGLVGIVAGLGLGVSLVRHIASAVQDGKGEAAQHLRWTALLISVAVAAIVVAAALPLSDWVAMRVLGNPDLAGAVPLLSLTVGLTLMAGIEQATLNGWHRVTALTWTVALSSLAGGAATVALVTALGIAGIAPGLLATAFSAFLISSLIAMRVVGLPSPQHFERLLDPARKLITAGAPLAASQLVGTGAQLLVPVVVLYSLDSAAVGFYRAASTVSVGYLAFTLNALAQDYYPRVAAAPIVDLQGLVERRTRLVLALSMPLVLAALALAPMIVAFLYSSEFGPAVSILRWQLIGDLLKLPSWAMAFAILARGRSGTFFAVELVGGLSLVVGVAVATRWFGLPGAGIGYLFSYAVYYAATWWGIRRLVPLVPGRLQLIVVLLAVALVTSEVILGDQPVLLSALLLFGAVAIAALAWPRLWRLHRAGEL